MAITVKEQTAASVTTPASGEDSLYFDSSSGALSFKDDAAAVHTLLESSAAGIPATIVNAKADLIVATAADTVDRLAVGTNGFQLVAASGESTGLKWVAQPVELMFAVSDETTAITTGTAKLTFRMPFAMTLTAVRANVNTASASGGPLTVDINEGGTTILSTKLTIDDTEKTSTTAGTGAVISDANLADDAEMTVDIDTAGTGAKGLKITLIGTRA